MKFTFKDASFTLPTAWQQLEHNEQRAVYGSGDSVLMLQYFPLTRAPSIPDMNSMMGGFAKNNKVAYSQEEATLGGQPARVATSRLHDNRLQLAAVIPRASGILALIGMGPDDDRPLETFKSALESLSFAGAAQLMHYHHAALKLSIDVPQHWQVTETDDFPLHLFAPEEQGFRASLGFTHMIDEQAIDIVALAKYLQQQTRQEFEGFVLDQEQPALLDGREAFMDRYYWQAQGQVFSQMNTFISQQATQVVRVHGYCLRSLESRYVPVFLKILLSIQFDT